MVTNMANGNMKYIKYIKYIKYNLLYNKYVEIVTNAFKLFCFIIFHELYIFSLSEHITSVTCISFDCMLTAPPLPPPSYPPPPPSQSPPPSPPPPPAQPTQRRK